MAGGLVLGAIVAVLVGRLLQTLLFDVRPSDPMALGTAALAFGVVALVALPAAGVPRQPGRPDGGAASGVRGPVHGDDLVVRCLFVVPG